MASITPGCIRLYMHSVEEESGWLNIAAGLQVRLLSQNKHELLRRVPDGLADVFRIGSTAPGQAPAPPLQDCR